MWNRAEAERHVKAVEDALRAGYPAVATQGHNKSKAALAVAANASGVHETTFRHRIGTPEKPGRYWDVFSLRPDWTIRPQDQFSAYEAIHIAEKPRVRVKVYTPQTPPEGPSYRILAIGDVHDKPGRDKDRLKWIARLACDIRPDRIVAIGDWLSLDSLSAHPRPGSGRDHNRPAFHEDLESGEESLAVFNDHAPVGVPRDITLGNHEHRAWRSADAQPKQCGDLPDRVNQVFSRYGWRSHDYGKWLYIGGVGFIHVPLNQMGREYGGKHSENTIGNDATHSVVWGHDHRHRFKTLPKIGPNNSISLLNTGTAMPWGVIEDYNVGTTGWSYGVVDMRIQGGLIVSHRFIDMIELQERYGD